MSAGRLLAIRVLGSVLVTVIAMGCAGYLLLMHIEVPAAWWGIAGVAVGGIVGAASGAIAEGNRTPK